MVEQLMEAPQAKIAEPESASDEDEPNLQLAWAASGAYIYRSSIDRRHRRTAAQVTAIYYVLGYGLCGAAGGGIILRIDGCPVVVKSGRN